MAVVLTVAAVVTATTVHVLQLRMEQWDHRRHRND